MQKIIHFLEKYTLLVVLFFTTVFVFTLGSSLPIQVKNIFYTISVHIKAWLLFLLPFLVLPYIVTSIFNMKGRGPLLVFGLFFLIVCSNFIAIMVGYGVGSTFVPLFSMQNKLCLASTENICALVDFFIDPFFSIEFTLACGILLGFFLNVFHLGKVERLFVAYRDGATYFFQKIFTPLLPFYILGLLLKLEHDCDCGNIFVIFQGLAFLIIFTQITYITFLFCVGKGRSFFKAIRAALPAGFVGFSTISSVVTMPLTLEAAEKNTKDKNLARLTITSTVNCHAIGDCIALPMIALAIYYMTFQSIPDLSLYLPFAFVLTLAQFGAVSVAGGSVIIITPLLSQDLGFSQEMIGLMIAISVFSDPWGTACNVMGNSGFVTVVEKIYRFFSKKS